MSFLIVTVLLSLAVVAVAGLSEGRLRHVLRIAFGLERNRGKEHVYDEIERPASDWSLLQGIHAEPEELSGADRAKAWTIDAYGQAKDLTRSAFDAGREQIAKAAPIEPSTDTSEFPTTGELAVGRR
ncbi:hypothetical protein [Demequina flava]|uniref:hypothetical protein n=1 Tax=Demequina flava TaxID=1095025 RepID=UPI00128E8741|nr:hypothetical protein [Demequina flava]